MQSVERKGFCSPHFLLVLPFCDCLGSQTLKLEKDSRSLSVLKSRLRRSMFLDLLGSICGTMEPEVASLFSTAGQVDLVQEVVPSVTTCRGPGPLFLSFSGRRFDPRQRGVSCLGLLKLRLAVLCFHVSWS